MLNKKTLAGMASLLLLASCGKKTDSQVQHTMDHPIRATEGFNWVDMTGDEFVQGVLGNVAPNTEVLPEDHELAKKAASWLAKLDTKLRTEHPNMLAEVPAPKAKVIVDSSPNAFVATGFVCYEIDVEIRGNGTDVESAGVYIDLNDGGRLYRWPENDIKCVKRTDPDQLKAALAHFNTISQGCQVAAHANKIVVSGSCPMADAAGVVSAPRMVIPQVANWVTVTSGLYELMKEEGMFVAVMAHELGHYYKSHGLSLSGEYDYYYTIGESNHTEKPEADASLKEFGDRVYKASSLMMGAGSFFKVADQELGSSMYLAAGDLSKKVCDNAGSACPTACSLVANRVDDQAYIADMEFFPFLAPKNGAAYTTFENDAKTCLDATTLEEAGLTMDDVAMSIAMPEWNPLEGILSDGGKQYVARELRTLAERVEAPESFTTIFNLLSEMVKKMEEEEAGAFDLVKEAFDRRLGQYTSEQEADDLSVEWLTDLGLDPKYAVDTYMSFATMAPDDGMSGLLLGGTRCSELRAADWQDDQGNDVFVPIGDYSENHHSSCFRAYNAAREIEAHELSVSNLAPALSEGWSSLVELATEINAEPEVDAETEETAEENTEAFTTLGKWRAKAGHFLGKHDPVRTCPMAH